MEKNYEEFRNENLEKAYLLLKDFMKFNDHWIEKTKKADYDLMFQKTSATAGPPVVKKQNYVDEFLSLRCAGDVLNVCNPILNARKEISESMALIKKIKPLIIPHKGKYNILDLCAGNALTSVLAVHLLPISNAIAIDKRVRDRQWDKVKRFHYVFGDIYNNSHFRFFKDIIDKDTIIVSSHPCGELARQIIKIYKESNAKALFIMPCCEGKLHRKYPNFIRTKIGRDGIWCWDLAQDIGAKLSKDNRCLSPKNIILSHVRD